MTSHRSEAVVLTGDEYDEHGWPLARITIERREYSLALGRCSTWVAEIEGLSGYYGEGATPEEALRGLRGGPHGLGPAPHFRVPPIPLRKLKGEIERRGKGMIGALRTRAAGFPDYLGGGGVDATAKELRVRKATLTAARAELSEKIDCRRELVAGLSKEALQIAERAEGNKMELDLWIAEQTPWRLLHAMARRKFPSEKA